MDEPYSAANISANNFSSSGMGGSVFQDWMNDSRAEAADVRQSQLSAWQANVNSQEAEKSRQWQENMSNTAYRRQAADLAALGFSPLAALGGSGASTPSGATASVAGAKSHSGSAGSPAGIIGSLIGAGAMIASKSMALGVSTSTAAADAMQKNQEMSKLVDAISTGQLKDETVNAAFRELSKNNNLGEALKQISANRVAAEQKALKAQNKKWTKKDWDEWEAFLNS